VSITRGVMLTPGKTSLAALISTSRYLSSK
jgi:hypothetical protein